MMVTLADAMEHVRVTADEGASEVQRMIDAAEDHLRSIGVDQLDADPRPPALDHAVLLLVGHFYQNREATVDAATRILPLGVPTLIAPFRSVVL